MRTFNSSDLEGGKTRCKSLWPSKARPNPSAVSWTPNAIEAGGSGGFLALSWVLNNVKTGGCWGSTDVSWTPINWGQRRLLVVSSAKNCSKVSKTYPGVCWNASHGDTETWGSIPNESTYRRWNSQSTILWWGETGFRETWGWAIKVGQIPIGQPACLINGAPARDPLYSLAEAVWTINGVPKA